MQFRIITVVGGLMVFAGAIAAVVCLRPTPPSSIDEPATPAQFGTKPVITFRRFEKNIRGEVYAVVELSNPTSKAVQYTSFVPQAPFAGIERRSKGKWLPVELKYLKCGLGLKSHTLPSGDSFEFRSLSVASAALFQDAAPKRKQEPIRVGINLHDENTSIPVHCEIDLAEVDQSAIRTVVDGVDAKSLVDLKTMQGRWNLEYFDFVEIDELVFTRSSSGQSTGLRFKLDATKTPKQIDFYLKHNVVDSQGIYHLNGGKLNICVDLATGERPKTFEHTKTQALWSLSRQRK